MTNAEHVMLASKLRMAVIRTLVIQDLLDNGALDNYEEKELEWRAREIYSLKCCTKMLPRLFKDVREMREEKGQFSKEVTVADLKWCLENRVIGYKCYQRTKYSWLPDKSEKKLRELSEYKAIANEYKLMLAKGMPILPPKYEQVKPIEILNKLTITKEN